MDVPICFSGSEEDIGSGSKKSIESDECVREHLWEDPEGRRSLWPAALRTGRDGLKKLLRQSAERWRGSNTTARG